MSLLGIDVGTTGTKAVAFDSDGRILGQAYQEYAVLHPRPDWIELDPRVIWEAVTSTVRRVAAETGSDPVSAMAFSVLGEAVTPVDENGTALYNSITSPDFRCKRQSEWWEQALGGTRIAAISGLPPSPMYTLHKIMWLRDEMPEVFGRAWKFLCYHDYLLHKLGLPPVIDYSLASRTMIFDVRQGRWSAEVVGMAGLSDARLPELRPAGTVVGEIGPSAAGELGLNEGVMVVVGGHDQPCNALGAGQIDGRVAVVATGTVECLTVSSQSPWASEAILRTKFPCYRHVNQDAYVVLAYNNTGGNLLKWYRDNLGSEEVAEARAGNVDPYEIIINQTSNKPSDIFVLAHFAGGSPPDLDPNSRGAILGLSLSSTRRDLAKGILESLTYELKRNINGLENTGLAIDKLRAIGGGARSRRWLQLKADITGKPVATINVAEAGCLGAAILAGVGAGVFTTREEAVEKLVRETEVFHPDSTAHKQYHERYTLYNQIYSAIREVNHRIASGFSEGGLA